MKAILVIEIDNTVNLDDVEIRYAIQDMYGLPVKAEVEGCKLKPMPKKIIETESDKTYWECPEFYDGYNVCIDEILGGAE